MKLPVLIAFLLGMLPAFPVAAEPEIWVGTIAAHTIVCNAAEVDGSSPGAVAKAGKLLTGQWPSERLKDVGPEFGTAAETPGAVVICAQYFGDNADLPAGLVLRQRPATSALFAYCPMKEAKACQARLKDLLGDTWRGERWSRWRFGWVKRGSPPAEELIPTRGDLERFSVERDPSLTVPNAQSELQPVGEFTVARLTEEDADRIRAELAKPPAAPLPGPSPAPLPPPPGGQP